MVGVLGDILGSFWCGEFLNKLRESGINPKIAKVYVDDNTIVTKPVPPGSRFRDDRVIIVEEEIENDRDVPADLRTARILNDVGNSVCPFISVTVNCASNHEDGFLPILDLKTRIINNEVEYRFFKKPSSSRVTIMASSALPPNVKQATLTSEVLRRIYHRTSGGAIGDRWVGVLGDILGSFWCGKFLNKLSKSGINPRLQSYM